MHAEQRAKFVRTEGDQAVFRLENGQELRWKAEALPARLKNGEDALLRLVSLEAAGQAQDKLAEQMLNELLRS